MLFQNFSKYNIHVWISFSINKLFLFEANIDFWSQKREI